MSPEILQDPSSKSALTALFSSAARPALCLEINPPRGVDLAPIFARLDGGALEGVDILNVTDCALARMKLAALPFAALLKQRYGKEPVVNISCRDRNLIALQADLLAAWASGIRSVVALTGDAVTVGDSPERKAVFEVNSIGLLNAIHTLNSGQDLAGNKLSGAPAFVSGVVVNPNAKNVAAELKRLRKKKEAGALFALSQPVFDLDAARSFLSQAADVGVPIFLGLLPFKNAQAAHAMLSIPGIRMPEGFLNKIESFGAADLSQLSIQHCVSIAEGTAGMVAGFHVVSGAHAKLGLELVAALAKGVCAR
jgi:5,10-methylenetetrahydrofolate reductase